MELVPGEPAAAAVLGQPVDDDAAVCGNQRHAPRHVGRARPCHAAVLFANAAESFSPNGAASPLPKRGPQEIRSVAKALNRMRERITALMDERTKMLAAISHDLRTPITRMRLRSEFIEDEAHRSRMLADLDRMRSMLEQVLSFLRDACRLAPPTLSDIATTL